MTTAWKSLTIGLFVAGVLLVGFAGSRVWAWRSQVNAQQERDRAVAAASDEVKRLVTISGKNADVALEQILNHATASFRSDLQRDAKRLQQELADQKVVATGSVVAAGIGPSTSDSATVYVAAQGAVANAATASPQRRDYRVKVTVRKVGGRWLVAGLEFVA